MRNLPHPRRIAGLTGGLTLAALFLTGCTPPQANNPRQALDQGYAELASKNYDGAAAAADSVLGAKPAPAAEAEAHYLRGRAVEERVKPDQASADADLQKAREEYVRALELNPPEPLAAKVRASVANVAYFQDDYATALSQWGLAYDHLEGADDQAWALYRIGLCQQRLGQWDRADRTFADVQQQYPNTTPAQRAHDKAGARAFYVQLGAFKDPAGADRAMQQARLNGVSPQKTVDARGMHVVRAGPFDSYLGARATKTRVAGAFPDATVVP
jgi:tetratricopeptide (TPR) repeat protein